MFSAVFKKSRDLKKSINISYDQGVEAGIGGQSSYDVGCILFSNIKKQKKSLYFEFRYKKQKTKNKVQIQIQIQLQKTKLAI